MSKKSLLCLAAMGAFVALVTGAAQAAPEAADLVPPPIDFPVNAGFMKVLQLLTFLMHLLAANILLGSVLLAIIDRRVSASDKQGEVAFMPKVLALAVNFAIAPFLFLQVLYGNFLYSSAVLMAVWWLGFFLLVMFAYYGLYISDSAASSLNRSLPLAVAALLILLTAFILTNVSTLMLMPERWLSWFSQPYGTFLNLGEPTLFPRYLHMIIASLAVGGLTMAWRAQITKRRPETDAAAADSRIRRGLDWFFYCSLAQVPVGLIFLFTLPHEIRSLFLGGSALYTVSLPLVLTGLVMALYQARLKNLKAATAAVLGIIFLMVCVRAMVREALLQPYMDTLTPSAAGIAMPQGQGAALALFLACAAFGAAVIFWMLRVLVKALGNGSSQAVREG